MHALVTPLNEIADAWLRFCAAGLIQGALWLAAALILWRLIQPRAAAQFGYWLFALVALKLISPVEILIPKHWIGMGTVEESAVATRSAGLSSLTSNALMAARVETAPPASAAPQLRARPVAEPRPTLSAAAAAMLIWATVVAVGLLRLAWIQRRTIRLVQSAHPVDGTLLNQEFAQLCRQIRVKPDVRLLCSSQISSPAAACPRAPCVIVPTELLDILTARQRRWTLLHELAHIRRGDLWASLVQSLLQTLFFFNPVIWIAGRMISSLREYACDDEASAVSGIGNKESGQGFLAIVEFTQQSAIPALNVHAVGIHRRHARIRRRMMRLVQRERRERGRLTWPMRLALVLMAAVMLPSVHAQSGDKATVAARIAALEAELELLRSDVVSQTDVVPAQGKTNLRWDGNVVAPGSGKQRYVVHEIDTSGLPEKGFLKVQIEVGDGESGVSFDLFPADAEVPESPEQQERLRQSASLASRYDVKSGEQGEIVYPYKRGEKFKLAASGDWSSPESSQNTFSVSVEPVDAKSIDAVSVMRSATPRRIVGQVRTYSGGAQSSPLATSMPSITITSPDQLVAGPVGVARTTSQQAAAKPGNSPAGVQGAAVTQFRSTGTPTLMTRAGQLDLTVAGTGAATHGTLFVPTSGKSLLDSELRLEAPGPGKQDYRVVDIETADFDGDNGVLVVRVTMGADACLGSFDLFRGDTEMPESPEEQETLRARGSLAHLYDLRPGQVGTLIYPFEKGQKFKLGATGSWASDASATNSTRINVRVANFSSQVTPTGAVSSQ